MKPRVTAVWLQTRGDRIIVMVKIDNQWYEVINELCGDRETSISYCAHLDNLNWESLKAVDM